MWIRASDRTTREALAAHDPEMSETGAVQCGACRRENPPDSKFCNECGARIGAPERRDERKVVTILFADLVGFTSRAELLDVEDVRAILAPFHESLRGVLESFGGTVEKFIGDAVMAVFGAPVAREDDAERAVRAALAIRDGLGDLGGDLHARIGVNTGEALVVIGADPQTGEGMVSGDVVNTAARLQTAAAVDTVLVGEATYRAAVAQIAFEAHEPVDAKGKRARVPCWTALSARSRVPIAQRAWLELVGRDRERRLLVDTFEHSRAEGRAQLVTVLGVPGIGKSRLVGELRAHVEADADLTTWRHGHVLAYGEGVGFSAIAEVVKQECGILDSDDAHTADEKLDAAIAVLGLEGVDARWVRNQVGPLIGLDAAADGSTRAEAFAGWRQFLEAIAADSPTVLVLDDLQWADDALLDFVDELVDRVSRVPLLVLATARPELLERRPDWAGGKPNALTIGLGPLSADHTRDLIGQIVDPSLLPSGYEADLLDRVGGNPLYAQEYVRALVEHGASARLPETVQGIIAARLDGLSPAEKRLVQDAAVVGATIWRGALCALGERDATEVDEIVERLERKQLLRRARHSSLAGEMEITFEHSLLRDVAYSQLPRAERAEGHRRVAAWLEQRTTDRADRADLLAHHYWTAFELHTDLGDDVTALAPRALHAVTSAARQSAARHDHAGVVRWAERGLRLDPDPTIRAELLALDALAAFVAGEPDGDRLLAALDASLATERYEDAVHLACVLSEWAEYYVGDLALAHRYESEAVALASTLPPGPVTSLPAYLHTFRLGRDARPDDVIAFADSEIARAEAAGADSAVGLMLIGRGFSRVELGDLEGIADIERAIELLRSAAHPKLAVTTSNLGGLLAALGRSSVALATYEQARSIAQLTGDRFCEANAALCLARQQFDTGDPATAADTANRAALLVGTGTRLAASFAMTEMALSISDDPERCAESARALLERGESEDLDIRWFALSHLVRAEHALGHHEARDDAVATFLAEWTTTGGGIFHASTLVEIGLGLVATGRHQELATAAETLETIQTPYADAARALARRDFEAAASSLEAVPNLPLAEAARQLAGHVATG